MHAVACLQLQSLPKVVGSSDDNVCCFSYVCTFQHSKGATATYIAGNLSKQKSVAQLLAVGANPAVVAPYAPASGNLLNNMSANGNVA